MHNQPPSAWTGTRNSHPPSGSNYQCHRLIRKRPHCADSYRGRHAAGANRYYRRRCPQAFHGLGLAHATAKRVCDPYSGTPLPEPPRSWSRYKVTFFANRPAPDPVYTVVYQFDPNVNEGYIYVPRTELNSRTIWRGGMEEWWFRASASWEHAVRPLIAQAKLRR